MSSTDRLTRLEAPIAPPAATHARAPRPAASPEPLNVHVTSAPIVMEGAGMFNQVIYPAPLMKERLVFASSPGGVIGQA